MNAPITETRPRFRAYDSYVRANAKGTGSACKLELHPAHDDSPGSVFVTLATQKTIGSYQGGMQVFPTFDWANSIIMKLDRSDLSQVIQVLRGMRESINEGKGIFHRSARANTIIKFAHQIDPTPGYILSASRKTMDGTLTSAWFFFDVDQALTLMLSLEQAMLYVCLGIPEVIQRSSGRVILPAGRQPSEAITIEEPAVQETQEYRAASGDPF